MASVKVLSVACTAIIVGFVAVLAVQTMNSHRTWSEIWRSSLFFQSVAIWLEGRDTKLPPSATGSKDGSPLQSWRLDYVRENTHAPYWSLPSREPLWNSEEMQKYVDYGYPFVSRDDQTYMARMLAVVGKDTGFDLSNADPPPDLSENLIILVENTSTKCHWMEPCELDVDTLPSNPSWPPHRSTAGGFFVIFADYEVWFISNQVPAEKILPLLRQSTAVRNSRESLLAGFVMAKFHEKSRRMGYTAPNAGSGAERMAPTSAPDGEAGTNPSGSRCMAIRFASDHAPVARRRGPDPPCSSRRCGSVGGIAATASSTTRTSPPNMPNSSMSTGTGLSAT